MRPGNKCLIQLENVSRKFEKGNEMARKAMFSIVIGNVNWISYGRV